jgi:hypothetical protein
MITPFIGGLEVVFILVQLKLYQGADIQIRAAALRTFPHLHLPQNGLIELTQLTVVNAIRPDVRTAQIMVKTQWKTLLVLCFIPGQISNEICAILITITHVDFVGCESTILIVDCSRDHAASLKRLC